MRLTGAAARVTRDRNHASESLVDNTVKSILWAGAFAAGIFFAATSVALAGGRAAHAVRAGHSAVVEAASDAARQGLQGTSAIAHDPAVHERSLGAARGRFASESHTNSTGTESLDDRTDAPGTTPFPDRPWIEGYEPAREDALFRASYPVLPSHNILKIYVSDSPSYGAAGIRFSARVPHTNTDITEEEMEHEAVALIRTAFDRFPDLQTLDVWATIPVDKTHATSVESTVFSISADRATYLEIRDRGLTDEAFLAAFGRMWVAPQVPQ